MKVPLNWLENYIKLEHTPDEFGDIMTNLEFMQDGAIIDLDNGTKVIDLEVRQNRPDILSIIGVAREYAAYINKKVELPESLKSKDLDWNKPSKNLSVSATDIVNRFCTVEIKNIKVKKSPQWLIESLEAYGVPSINNIVDITNYVMIEYGIPLHAFDKSKLETDADSTLLNLRRARPNEEFETWQGTQIKLNKEDLVVSDAKKPVAIAGIIGGANSDIQDNTTEIILEAAVYNQAFIRRTSMRHAIRTEASARHEKFLNPEMVQTAITRALFLIQELAGGEIINIEDFYDNPVEKIYIDFNTYEISRIGGVTIEINEIVELLTRLGFDVIDQKEAIGLDKNILTVGVPFWRTDIIGEMDIVEEILRLWGYENIPFAEISAAPPNNSTPSEILLEDKIKDILVSLGLDEHIINPIVEINPTVEAQIKIENPLNAKQGALRTTIRETLTNVIEFNHKAGEEQSAVFESGKVYIQKKNAEYVEKKRIETLYSNIPFIEIKADFLAVLSKLGILNSDNLSWEPSSKNLYLRYIYNKVLIGELYRDGFMLDIENLSQHLDTSNIPSINLKTDLRQRIIEEISLVIDKNEQIGKISDLINKSSEYIKSIEVRDIYSDAKLESDKISTTISILFEDIEKNLTREKIEEIKKDILKNLKSKYGVGLRS